MLFKGFAIHPHSFPTMATDVSAQTNGTYAPHQGYGASEQNNYASYNSAAQTTSQAPTTSAAASSTTANQQDVSKDEVGWYFVEQYYTTLSRTPERLYLFYNKRSQFVSGQETDKVEVCVGQRAINDKIQQLDFQDCKVRVTNVDSQASDSNIVIQVIGEISNKSQPHKKFTQTFVLATQTNGYFVLNDIFRYLVEDDDEVEPETSALVEETAAPADVAAAPTEPKTLADPVAVEKVDKSLEETVAKEHAADATPEAKTNGHASEESAAVEAETSPDTVAEEAAPAVEAEVPEQPKEPEATRVPTPVSAPAAQPAAASKPVPALPKTWATLAAAANKVATPVMPAAPSSVASKQQKAAPTAAAPTAPSAAANSAAPAAASPTPSASTPAAAPKDAQDDEWTAVGGSHNRQQSKQINPTPVEAPTNRGYIKGVFEHVPVEQLRAAVEQFGELSYFDVARAPKVCYMKHVALLQTLTNEICRTAHLSITRPPKVSTTR